MIRATVRAWNEASRNSSSGEHHGTFATGKILFSRRASSRGISARRMTIAARKIIEVLPLPPVNISWPVPSSGSRDSKFQTCRLSFRPMNVTLFRIRHTNATRLLHILLFYYRMRICSFLLA